MHEYILTPSLTVSFQRYRYPHAATVTDLATSCGALPLHILAPGHLAVPCPNGEAFWIGLIPSPAGHQYRLNVLVSTTSGERVDALTGAPAHEHRPPDMASYHMPPPLGIPGIRRTDGRWWAFARDSDTPAPACRVILLSATTPATAPTVGDHADPGRPRATPGQTPWRPTEAGDAFTVRVDIVEPAYFQALTGEPVAPLNESKRYGGWRLP
jgi:hypothetical protein